jgi:hypothetical protein
MKTQMKLPQTVANFQVSSPGASKHVTFSLSQHIHVAFVLLGPAEINASEFSG